MIRKAFALGVILFLALGFSVLAFGEVKEGSSGKVVPVITQSFASNEVRPGQNWNVYLNVSDPQGNIRNILFVVDQPGVGEYPVSITRVRTENSKELSGYFSLGTSAPDFSAEFVKLALTVYVQDESGKFSQPVVFPLFITERATGEMPPKGVFKDQAIGRIMVQLHGIFPED